MSCRTVLCRAGPDSTVSDSAGPCRTVPCRAGQFCAVPCRTVPCCAVMWIFARSYLHDDADSDVLCSDIVSCALDLRNDADSDDVCGDVDSCAVDAADDVDGLVRV